MSSFFKKKPTKKQPNQNQKPVSAAEAKVNPSADSTGMHLKAEHVQVFTTSRDAGQVHRRPVAKLLYNQTKLNTQKQHVFYILVKNTE